MVKRDIFCSRGQWFESSRGFFSFVFLIISFSQVIFDLMFFLHFAIIKLHLKHLQKNVITHAERGIEAH